MAAGAVAVFAERSGPCMMTSGGVVGLWSWGGMPGFCISGSSCFTSGDVTLWCLDHIWSSQARLPASQWLYQRGQRPGLWWEGRPPA